MDITHNFSVYRRHVRHTELPAVPYLGVVLRDVTLLNEGSPDLLRGEVNIEKIRMIASLCNEAARFRDSRFDAT